MRELNDQNVTYVREKESTTKMSVVNANQIQYNNNPQEDQQFFNKLDTIISEYSKPIMLSNLNYNLINSGSY